MDPDGDKIGRNTSESQLCTKIQDLGVDHGNGVCSTLLRAKEGHLVPSTVVPSVFAIHSGGRPSCKQLQQSKGEDIMNCEYIVFQLDVQ